MQHLAHFGPVDAHASLSAFFSVIKSEAVLLGHTTFGTSMQVMCPGNTRRTSSVGRRHLEDISSHESTGEVVAGLHMYML